MVPYAKMLIFNANASAVWPYLNATATPNALLKLDNACNVPNLTLDHCVSQKWFNAPNAPVAALDLGVRGRKPKRCHVWVHHRA